MNHKQLIGLSIVIAGLFIAVALILRPEPNQTLAPLGSVSVGSEYNATTTADMTAGAFATIISDAQATLGSIVVASSSAGTLQVWNATSTTDVSSTTVTTLKASIGEGTYTFDLNLSRGLIVLPGSGFDGDYVITFRQR